MSRETTEGWVEAISPKPNKDYIGIKLDNDEWFNGNDSNIPSMSKDDYIEVTHDDGWVQEINILEEANEDGQTDRNESNSPTGSGNSNRAKSSSSQNPQMSERQASIMANSATKMAVEHAETSYSEDKKGHIDEVNERSQAYQNIMKQRLGENL